MLAHIKELVAEAERCNHRRLVVIAGSRDEGIERIRKIFREFSDRKRVIFTWEPVNVPEAENMLLKHADRVMGQTVDMLAMDAHQSFVPNDLGKLVGTVRGGGLFFLLTPPLEEWKKSTNFFHESILTPPYTIADIRKNFIPWVISKLSTMPGIAIYQDEKWIKYGYAQCREVKRYEYPLAGELKLLSPDQKVAMEKILSMGKRDALVITADRGRGKSSVLGIAIAYMIHQKRARNVCITAPSQENLRELHRFLHLTLKTLGIPCRGTKICRGKGFTVTTLPPGDNPGNCDLLVVDEAAGIPVPLLLKYSKKRVVYSTTTHGYEGTGRAFTIRFLKSLKEKKKNNIHIEMHTPIRYSSGDPVEHWLFSTLLLDSEPAGVNEQCIKNAEYREYKIEKLMKDEEKLREFYGVFVLAHYRNNPNDLGIICDAPNHELRGLECDGHVVCSVQLAREGGLDEHAAEMYFGFTPPGNIVPDVLIKHYRDVEFARKRGVRIVRIATHPQLMSRGLGSRILQEIMDEGDEWVGASFGATPQLMRFWTRNGFMPIHISPRKNEKTGEYSVVVLHTRDGTVKTLARTFARRFVLNLAGIYRDMEPELAAEILRAIPGKGKINVEPVDWKRIIAYAWGPGNYEVTADALWKLAVEYFLSKKRKKLTDEQEHILIARVLQHRTWSETGRAVGRGDTYVVIELREAVRRLIGGEFEDEVLEFQRRFHGASD